MRTDAPVLSVRKLAVTYGNTRAVRGIDLAIAPGEAVCVIGSNGAGKTSTLRGIMGLVPAQWDEMAFAGRPLAGMPTHRLSHAGIGYVPEGRELFGGLTVEEELLIGGRLVPKGERGDRMAAMFALFPRLAERRRQVARTLSGGEQQMVAIARTLMFRPKLLLLDEPSLGLAPVIQDIVYAALQDLRTSGIAMLLVEQNAFRALQLCERAYVLEHGEIVRSDRAAILLGDETIQQSYLGS